MHSHTAPVETTNAIPALLLPRRTGISGHLFGIARDGRAPCLVALAHRDERVHVHDHAADERAAEYPVGYGPRLLWRHQPVSAVCRTPLAAAPVGFGSFASCDACSPNAVMTP